jgi:hypothetical protein
LGDDGLLRIKDDDGNVVKLTFSQYKDVSATIRNLVLTRLKKLGGVDANGRVDPRAFAALKKRMETAVAEADGKVK